MTRIFAAFVAVLVSTVAVAADKKAPPAAPPAQPPGPPKPAAEMDQLKWYNGNWKCEGKYNESPFGPARPYTFEVSMKPVLDNFWYEIQYSIKATKENPIAESGMEHWGYSMAEKKFVRGGVNNAGGMIHSTSMGFEGDANMWTGDVMGPMGKVPFKHTITKKGEKEGLEKFEADFGKGMTVVRESTCKKS